MLNIKTYKFCKTFIKVCHPLFATGTLDPAYNEFGYSELEQIICYRACTISLTTVFTWFSYNPHPATTSTLLCTKLLCIKRDPVYFTTHALIALQGRGYIRYLRQKAVDEIRAEHPELRYEVWTQVNHPRHKFHLPENSQYVAHKWVGSKPL